ncbi:MAG TPA: prephenate dehydrogenase/arogenate dehydrogenase family protein [Dehalococcoidia bacterium]|jgi:prephenate dehydrogenase
MERITIIGLGLIGGSIALAIKQSDLRDKVTVTGVARTRDTMQRAKKIGAVDETDPVPERAVRGARLVIVASPILTVPTVFEEIAPALEEGTIVTDVASVKAPIAKAARDILPRHSYFVGGHPMAGKEQAGIDAADATLFRDRPWVISPSVDAPESAVNTVIGLAQLCGARPLFMDPHEHDSYVAAISHLPLAVSSALFSVAFASAAWPELAGLASSGFRDTTRLASGSPEMAHDIMVTNKDNVLHWIDRLQEEITRLREVIARGDSKEIAEAFTRPQVERDNFMINGAPRRISGDEMPKFGLNDLLLGSKVSEMMRKQEEMVRASEKRIEERRK